MIYLLIGTDTYRVKAKIAEIRKQVLSDDNSLNFVSLESAEVDRLASEAMAMPFLSDKRMIVASGMLATKEKQKLEQILEVVKKVPESTVLVFVEAESPDNRLAVIKEMRSLVSELMFNALTPYEELNLIRQLVSERGGEIDPAASNLLQQYVGTDLSRLDKEIDKLLTYNKQITRKSVQQLVYEGYFNSIFDFTDAIGHKNAKKAITLLERILESGEDELYLISMLSMHVRNLLQIMDLRNHRLSQAEIVSKTKLHPYVVKKGYDQLGNFCEAELIGINSNLLEIDARIKQSRVDPRGELIKLIIEITKK